MSRKQTVLTLIMGVLMGVTTKAQVPRDTLFNQNVFNQMGICFQPDKFVNGVTTWGDTLRTANGRIILRKVKLPRLPKNATLTLRMRLRSAGDPWDKTGSCFVLPPDKAINMLSIAKDQAAYPVPDTACVGKLKGVMSGKDYVPAVELLRFITPFGVGYYSHLDSTESQRRMPVYVDGFAPFVEWTADISDRIPLFTQELYVGVYIDTWTKEGYDVSLDLIATHGSATPTAGRRVLLPLLNTAPYLGQELPDVFAHRSLSIPFTLPKKARRVLLHYVVTGHGGHSGGDEFVPRENIVTLDGNEVLRFTPWRNDCAAFRRYNPSTGVWLRTREVRYIGSDGRGLKTIEEPIASSDLSRSNWCPGSAVEPRVIRLNEVGEGRHVLRISIPEAQPAVDNQLNHWIVSAWLTWEE